LAQSRPVDHIYVVDNASKDATGEFLSGLDNPKISWKRLPVNTGGSGGFSYGMKWVFDEGHEWIWLMDDDVMQAQSCLQQLLVYGDGNRILLPTLPTLHDGGESAPGLAMKLNLDSAFRLGFRHPLAQFVYPIVDEMPPILPIEDLSFEGPLIHRSIPAKIGFPRADLFICFDDTEYAMRIKQAGMGPTIIVRDARMTTLVEKGNSYPLWRRYYGLRNELLVRSSYSVLMSIRVRFMFIVRTFWGWLTRKMPPAELKLRRDAFVDSFATKLPNRYPPGIQ